MNLIKNFLLFFGGIILLIVGIWVKWCLIFGIVLLFIDVVIALVGQIRIMNTAINSDDPNFTEWQNAMLSPDWKDRIMDLTETKMDDLNYNDSEE